MDMDSDERFSIEVLFVLKKIKKLSYYHIPPDIIEYKRFAPQNLHFEQMPFPVNENGVLKYLEKQFVIKRLETPEKVTSTFPEVPPGGLRVVITETYQILNPKFDRLLAGYTSRFNKRFKYLLRRISTPSKAEVEKLIRTIFKTKDFGKKEKSLLEILSDLEPHRISSLAANVPSKAIKKLKESVQRKLRGTNLTIILLRSVKEGSYLLKFLPR